jgi:hypothetical protein
MTKKYLTTLLLGILLPALSFAQGDEYGKFIQAIVKGDTALAMKIEKRNVTVEPIEAKAFPTRNVAEHVFPFRINQLKDTLAALFSVENQYGNVFLKRVFYNYMGNEDTSEQNCRPIVFNAETSKGAIFSEDYFSKSNTSNDIYLHTFGETWLSKLYFSKGKPLETRTAFAIKLFVKDGSSTKVAIVAQRPTVLNGIAGFGIHGPIARETEVGSSSIEEYSLLLFIAEKFGDKSLAPLITPDNK